MPRLRAAWHHPHPAAMTAEISLAVVEQAEDEERGGTGKGKRERGYLRKKADGGNRAARTGCRADSERTGYTGRNMSAPPF